MDYKVLYRKYRPADFSSIIGQDYIVSILKNAIKKDKISHAYIFSGPRGTGKTTTAKVFAKAINCLDPTENGPCNACENCLHFKENADIIEIDAASNNGVDEIREIINNIKLAPAYSKYKVYIIDEVHMLSTSAFNALLLTLEEPPKHVIFILATTNIEAVPITILSRAQRFDFHKISINDIIKRLKYVVNEENIDIDDEALEEIAYISDGGMRDALSILDQLSSNNTKITIKEVSSHFGSVSKKQINDLFACFNNNDVSKFVDMMQNFQNLAIDYKYLIKKLLEKIEQEAIKNKKDTKYEGLAYHELQDMAFELSGISNYVNININPYILIEITLLKYFSDNKRLENIPKQEEIKVEKEPEIEKKAASESSSISQNNQLEDEYLKKLETVRINNCFASASKDCLKEIKDNWQEFIKNNTDPIFLNLLPESLVVAASPDYAIITTSALSSTNLINKNLLKLEEMYNNAYQKSYHFIALTIDMWNKEKATYIDNLKNKKTYSYMPEPSMEKENTDLNSLEETAFQIFDKNKIEIE